jgi:preprotein translocase subunit Sec61beta
MAKKKASGSGLMSSAGLMRYYEADETAIRINPKTVVVIAVMAGIFAIALGFQYGTWPG